MAESATRLNTAVAAKPLEIDCALSSANPNEPPHSRTPTDAQAAPSAIAQ